MSDLTDRLRKALPTRHNLDACADLIDAIDAEVTAYRNRLPDDRQRLAHSVLVSLYLLIHPIDPIHPEDIHPEDKP